MMLFDVYFHQYAYDLQLYITLDRLNIDIKLQDRGELTCMIGSCGISLHSTLDRDNTEIILPIFAAQIPGLFLPSTSLVLDRLLSTQSRVLV